MIVDLSKLTIFVGVLIFSLGWLYIGMCYERENVSGANFGLCAVIFGAFMTLSQVVQ